MKTRMIAVLVSLAAMPLLAVNWNIKSNANATGLSGSTWERADDPTVTSTTLNSGDDYFADNGGSTFAGSSAGQIFTGHSLTIGPNKGTTFQHYYTKGIYGDSDLTFQNEGVILACGHWQVSYGNASQPHIVNGTVKLVAGADKPFRFSRNGDSANGLKFMDKFWGDGAATIDAGTKAPSFSFALLGDYSEFSGTLTLTSDTTGATPRYAILQLASGTSPLTVNVGSSCRLSTVAATDAVTLGTVNLSSDAVLDLKAAAATAGESPSVVCSKFAIARGLSVEADAKAAVAVTFDASAAELQVESLDLLTVPKTISLNKDAFVYLPQDSVHLFESFEVRDDGETRTLVARFSLPKRPMLTQADDGDNNKGIAGVKWSDGSVGTSPDYDYAVLGKRIYLSSSGTPNYNASNEFHGASLRIGDALQGSEGVLYQYGGQPVTADLPSFGEEGLVLACGSWRTRYAHPYRAAGKVTVTSVTPFRIFNEQENAPAASSLTLLGPLAGSGSLRVESGINANSASSDFCLKLLGGAEEFTGTIAVTSQVSNIGIDCHAGVVLTNGPMPAAVTVGHGSYLVLPAAGEQATIRSLTMDAGAELRATAGVVMSGEDAHRTCGALAVTESFQLNGKVKVSLQLPETDSLVGGTFPFLIVPVGSALSAEDVELCLSNEGSAFNRGMTVTVETDAVSGSKTFKVAIPEAEVVYQTASDKTTAVTIPTSEPSSLTNANNWSDGKVPHQGAHYVCRSPGNGERVLRTRGDETGAWTFPGRSLSIEGLYGYSTRFILLYTDFTVPLLRFADLTTMGAKYTDGGVTVHGEICVESGSSTWTTYAGGLFAHDGPLTGSGDLVLTGMGMGTSNHGGDFELQGTNTAFAGTLKLTIGELASDNVPSPTADEHGRRRYQRMFATDGRNFGGAMEPANPKGVVIDNYSQILTRNSLTIYEPTRGWYIGLCGRLNVAEEDHLLTFASPLAVDGTLAKEGPGTLVLANPQPTFGADAMALEPSAEIAKRTFLVDDGTVGIASAFALNGLNVTVTNDAPVFALDVDAEDADLAAYGLVDILTPDCPFVVTDAATKLHFRLGTATGAKPAWSERTVAVCTVKADQASAVAALLDVKAVRGTGIRVTAIRQEPVIVNETSCVTFVADLVANQGLMLIVK